MRLCEKARCYARKEVVFEVRAGNVIVEESYVFSTLSLLSQSNYMHSERKHQRAVCCRCPRRTAVEQLCRCFGSIVNRTKL